METRVAAVEEAEAVAGGGAGKKGGDTAGGGAAAPDPIATAGMGGSTTAGLGEEVGADK